MNNRQCWQYDMDGALFGEVNSPLYLGSADIIIHVRFDFCQYRRCLSQCILIYIKGTIYSNLYCWFCNKIYIWQHVKWLFVGMRIKVIVSFQLVTLDTIFLVISEGWSWRDGNGERWDWKDDLEKESPIGRLIEPYEV